MAGSGPANDTSYECGNVKTKKTDPHWGNNIQTDCACIRGPSQAGWLTGIKKELLRMTDVYGG